jgi:hypothetical protein
MFSVVVHGRNDAHGYNLHRRVALSLNAVASLLDGDDEMIFVDWNTPDILPTLPEAIADTLTAATRQRLRVLRVREARHARFATRTHLPVLDPVARNVALRRVAPTSRWFLSTTTDMIFVPRRETASWRDLLGDLPDGLYHCPRFDLPEFLWEGLDRRDPATAIAEAGRLGTALRLDEVVLADPAVLFDGPGDFQLFPCAAAAAVHGFDERMLYTYHMDSNLARRLGPPRSVGDRLRAYHCSHYRVGSVHHAQTRVENDTGRFVYGVTDPAIPEQAESWGMAGEDIEEIRLTHTGPRPDRRQVMAAAVERVLTRQPPAPVATISATADRFNDLSYDINHVLAFLADLLTTLPPGTDVGVCATDPVVVARLTELWREAGLTGALLVETAIAAGLGDGAAGLSPLERHEWLTRPGAFLFAVPAAPFTAVPSAAPAAAAVPAAADDLRIWDADHQARLYPVAAAFLAVVDAERQRPAALPSRRIIVVNAINNALEAPVGERLSTVYTPFTSRVRQGTVPRPQPADIGLFAGWLTTRLQRPTPVPYAEVAAARDLLLAVAGGAEPEAIPPACAALLEAPGFAAACGIDPARLPMIGARIAGLLQTRRAAVALPLVLPGSRGGLPALSKICDPEDWEIPAWFACLTALDEGERSRNVFCRHRAAWETAHLLYGLRREAAARPVRRILVAADHPEPFHARLTDRLTDRLTGPPAGQVAGQPMGRTAGATVRVDVQLLKDRASPHPGTYVCPGALLYWPAVPADSGHQDSPGHAAADYDAVVLPRHVAPTGGVCSLIPWLAWADARLASGGLLILSGEVTLGGATGPGCLDARLVADGRLGHEIAAATGFEPADSGDWSVSVSTVDCATGGNLPHMAVRHANSIQTTAIWALRKRHQTPAAAWAMLASRLSALAPVDLWPDTAVLDGRTGGAAGFRESLPFPLPLGRYALHIAATLTDNPDSDPAHPTPVLRAPVLRAVITAASGTTLAWRDFFAEDLAPTAALPFDLPGPAGDGRIKIRLHAAKGAIVQLTAVSLLMATET